MKNIIIIIFSIYALPGITQDAIMHINGMPVYRQEAEAKLVASDDPISILKTSSEVLWGQFYEKEQKDPSVWQQLWQLLPVPEEDRAWSEIPCTNSNALQVALVMDITGSMAPELTEMKQFWPDLSNILAKESILDQAQVHFRDEPKTGELFREDFSQALNLAPLYLQLARAGGGGEDAENWPRALAEAIDSLSWSSDAAARFIFFAIDAAPEYEAQTAALLQQTLKTACRKNIHMVPIAGLEADEALTYLLKSIAVVTNGFYLQMQEKAASTDLSAIVEEMQRRMAPTCKAEESPMSLSCFPNPASDYTYLALPVEHGVIRVTATSGQLIYQQSFSTGGQFEVNLKDWPVGTYHIEVSHDKQRYWGRIVKQ